MKLVFPSSIATGSESVVIRRMKDHVGEALRRMQLLTYTDLDEASWQPLGKIRGMGDHEHNQLLLFASSPATSGEVAPVVLIECDATQASGKDTAVGFDRERHEFTIAFADAKPSIIDFQPGEHYIVDNAGVGLSWSIKPWSVDETSDFLPTANVPPIIRAYMLSFKLEVPDRITTLVYRTVELRRKCKEVSISAFGASAVAGGMQNETRVIVSMIYGSRVDQVRAKDYLDHVLKGPFTEKQCRELFDATEVIVHKTGDATDRKLTSRADLVVAKGVSSKLVYDLLVAQHGCGYVGDPVANPTRNDAAAANYDDGSYLFTDLEPFAHVVGRKYGRPTVDNPTAEDLAAKISAEEARTYESARVPPLKDRLAMSFSEIANSEDPTWRQVLIAISDLFDEELGNNPTRDLIDSVMAWIVLVRGDKTKKYINLDVHPYVYKFFRPVVDQIASRQKLAVGREKPPIGREAIERYTHVPEDLTRIYGDLDFVVSPNYLEFDMPKEEMWNPDAKSGHNILWFQDVPEDYMPHMDTIVRELTNRIKRVCDSSVHFEVKDRISRGAARLNSKMKPMQDLHLILMPFDPNIVLIHETLARVEIQIKDQKFNCFFDFATDMSYSHQMKVNKTNLHKYRSGKVYPAYEVPPITYEIVSAVVNGNPWFLPKLGSYNGEHATSILSARAIWTSQMGTFLYAIPDAEGTGYMEASWIDIVATAQADPIQLNIVVSFLDGFIRQRRIDDVAFREFHETMRKLIDEGVAGDKIVDIPRDPNARLPHENVAWVSRSTIIGLVDKSLKAKPFVIEIEEGLETIDSYVAYDKFVKTKWPRIAAIANERHCSKYGIYQWVKLPSEDMIEDVIIKESKQAMTHEEKMKFFDYQRTLYLKLQEIRDAYRVVAQTKIAIRACGMNPDGLETRARQILELEKPATPALKRPKLHGVIRYEFQFRQPRLEEIKNTTDNGILPDLFPRNVRARGIVAFQTKVSDLPMSGSRDRKSAPPIVKTEVNIQDEDFGF